MSYYILKNDKTEGPYTIGQLRSMWNSGALTGDTLYCEEGYEEWVYLRDLADQLEAQPDSSSPPVLPPYQFAPDSQPNAPKKSGVGKAFGVGCLSILVLFILFTILGGMMNDGNSSRDSERNVAILSGDESGKICKGLVSLLFNHPIDDVKITRKEGDVMYLAHTRTTDHTTWEIKCRIQGSVIIWGNADGRWQTDKQDGQISFQVDRTAQTFTVREVFSDGSERHKTFSL